ncbi:MAG TPA: sigma-70 family RNA polymerase sigma factor [Thermoanaerobaculia bacterium]
MLDQETLEVPAAAESQSASPTPRRESAKASKPVEPHLLSADEVETLYIEHRTLLLFIASRKFHIADGEAENLIQEVFLSFLQTCTRIDNVRAWLVAAMCNASRHFWRAQGRTESLPDDYANACDPKTTGTADEHAMRLTMSKVLGYMQPKCRTTLRLHYFEGRSANEIAKELETTPRYAEKLIHTCLHRAREIYNNITAVTR